MKTETDKANFQTRARPTQEGKKKSIAISSTMDWSTFIHSDSEKLSAQASKLLLLEEIHPIIHELIMENLIEDVL